MIVTLLRHGSTAWNELGRMQGRRDIPLSERGRAQVRGWTLPAEIDGTNARWVSSPLRRAAETAQILSGGPVAVENALTEMDWGEWEGYALDELQTRYGDAYARSQALGLDFRAPGGESPREVLERARAWLASQAPSTESMIAVVHLGVLRALLSGATGWDMVAKAPVRFAPDTLHRFVVAPDASLQLVAANIPLVAAARPR